jgi:hypothetical protein
LRKEHDWGRQQFALLRINVGYCLGNTQRNKSKMAKKYKNILKLSFIQAYVSKYNIKVIFLSYSLGKIKIFILSSDRQGIGKWALLILFF